MISYYLSVIFTAGTDRIIIRDIGSLTGHIKQMASIAGPGELHKLLTIKYLVFFYCKVYQLLIIPRNEW